MRRAFAFGSYEVRLLDRTPLVSLVKGGRLPDYIIIGTQRAGTTSLFRYLSENPSVSAPSKKELCFFSQNYHKGLGWYRNRFPIKENTITGESTPYYMFHPLCAKRIANDVPNIKLIVMLRNPITRAYSSYWLQVEHGRETLSFEEAIDAEQKRIEGEEEKLIQDPNYISFRHRIYAYLAKGIYAPQLERYFKYFAKEKLLVLKSEDFFTDPVSTTRRALDFLGLSSQNLKEHLRQHNAIDYPKMRPETKKKLSEYYKPYNERLYTLLGIDFGW